jgi:hypothetical protein
MKAKKPCCEMLGRVLRIVMFALVLAAALSVRAATVWTGPVITYNQPTSDPTQASNQDRITPDVWLTRAATKGLFNAFYETNATTFSPTNTEWSFGTLTNYASLHYTNWLVWLNGASPTTLVGQQVVVHLISDDIYISIVFSLWNTGGSGGFACQRSTPPLVDFAEAKVSNGQFFFNYTTSAGFNYVIESSSNLVNWVSLVTNTASGSPVLFSNVLDSTGAKFYRVGRLPNP